MNIREFLAGHVRPCPDWEKLVYRSDRNAAEIEFIDAGAQAYAFTFG
jgi:hypothetical protein